MIISMLGFKLAPTPIELEIKIGIGGDNPRIDHGRF